ncbi:hypothetical protein [Streptosporangium roseum]|uniref:hypothetical protein n=1 Tax=Streptosporangium roseum TaxID=2001 RepID=UPI0001A3E568|nr:hypothetical protein [Streptosporangium roseum]
MRAELDGLAALLESHSVYEEKQIVAALNALSVPGWDASRPDSLLTGADAVPDPGVPAGGRRRPMPPGRG